MIKVLVVDDEEPFRRLLKKELTRKGFAVEVAGDGENALHLVARDSFDVVLLDIVMPGVDGITVMKRMMQDPSSPAIIVLTGRATVETAVEAMKNGAYDYLTKPYKLDELMIIINRAFEFRRLKMKNQQFQQELIRKESPQGFIFKTKKMEEIFNIVKKIAHTDSTVLIYGESGTGKEMIANLIWQHSNRKDAPFIALNCATLSENLIESELFGHERGAFTNAFQTKYGIVEVADRGTLFLDEIGETPIGLQAKLLRFLDSGEFRRIGGNKTLKADVRVITATNKDIGELARKGEFRQDLYYRLNVINITIPPLRDRKEDIPELADYFLKRYTNKLSKTIKGIDSNAMNILMNYHWPGNVRELENVIERAVILSDTDFIRPEDISISQVPDKEEGKLSSLDDVERSYILKVLKETGWNQSKASQILGIDRKTLYLKLKKYDIKGENP
mgnify:CR=1 FL=1